MESVWLCDITNQVTGGIMSSHDHLQKYSIWTEAVVVQGSEQMVEVRTESDLPVPHVVNMFK